MTTKHTPGPWRASGIDVLAVEHDQTKASPVICRGERDQFDAGLMTAEQLANAALIAAAPEMLDALQACLSLGAERAHVHGCPNYPTGEVNDRCAAWCVLARTAIAKAEGK